MRQICIGLLWVVFYYHGDAQLSLEWSPGVEYFNYARYPLSNVGLDARIRIGTHWSVYYQAKLGMASNQELYSHLGASQAFGGYCMRQWLSGQSWVWGAAGIITGWMPEGIGYRWNHKRLSSELNVSFWGYEQYAQRDPRDYWGFMSQTVQYRMFIAHPWKGIDRFVPYIAVTLNDDSWRMAMPALGWRLGLGVVLEKRKKAEKKKEQKVSAEDQFE
jgi:hypothetical protein